MQTWQEKPEELIKIPNCSTAKSTATVLKKNQTKTVYLEKLLKKWLKILQTEHCC